MWTPRRILLLLLGLAGFTAAYLGYARVLGSVDGLPDLPVAFLTEEEGEGPLAIIVDPVSPTIVRLQEAFGQHSPEVTDTVAYKTKLELRDKGLVFACGQPAFTPEPSRFVTVAPFSLANFGKPKPGGRKPGDVPEISTFHADKAVLEFDRPVSSPQDVNGKAKLVGIELVSTPDVASPDPRKGRVWVTNNQKSADPAEYLVFRTPGPLFYRTADAAPAAPDAPQVWTAAAVEVIDRKNLPRPLRSHASNAVPSRSDDLRGRNAVANILLGLTSPPPTVTAEGLKMYMEQNDPKAPPGKQSGQGGVRAIELTEKVQLNLWSDGGSGFPGSDAGQPKPAGVDPPAAAAGVLGGIADGTAVAQRLQSKSLLVIETLGPFRYDLPTSTARFEAAAAANPAVPNHVTVSRLSANGAQDNLFCKLLVVQFADAANEKKQPGAKPQPAGGGPKVKNLTATGEHVFVSVEAEQLLAQGTELRYEVNPTGTLTTLRGSPVNAVRERNRLQGGDAKTPAEIRIATIDPPAGSKEKKRNAVAVMGAGRIEMFDTASNDNTLQASWGTSLTQERQLVGGKEQDLLKFEGGSTFADLHGGMKLSADRQWLWIGAADGEGPPNLAGGKSANPTGAKPQRLVATGRVTSESPELRIRDTDQLTVWFRDVPPPAFTDPTRVAAKAPLFAPAGDPNPPAIQQASATEPAGEPAAKPQWKKDAEKKPVPMYLSARVVESWVIRYPLPTAAKAVPAKSANAAAPASGSLKYELERARCEDRVMVHQPPTDPAKSQRGVDIFGSRLNLDQSPAGGALTVYGSNETWAQVFFEDLSLFGPVVKIDQPQNSVAVDGKGRLVMPGGSDVAGGSALAGKPSEMEIKWTSEMRFNGAMATASFLGQVYAVQQPKPDDKPRPARVERAPVPRPREVNGTLAGRNGGIIPTPPSEPEDTLTRSALVCHRLDVTFDRPIYFNQTRRDGPRDNGKAKMRTALCTPMPDDEAKVAAPDRLVSKVYFLEDVIGAEGKIVRAHRITARQLDVKNDDREQIMYATGPGEVRLLQMGSKEQGGPEQPAAEKADEKEMKLTVVKFPSRMVASDKQKIFQEATFDDGARVVQVPNDDINATVVEYDLPPRGVFLACTEVMKVSTTRTRKDAPAEQRLSADGNARFMTDEYEGFAAKITYDGGATTLNGDKNGPAVLRRRRRVGLNNQDSHSGERIIYNRDGSITGSGTIGGSITPGQ